MSSTTPRRDESHEAAVIAFAEDVRAFLKTNERSLEWLARQSGVHPSTLRSQLIEKPTRLTYINAVRIARVVPVQPLEDVAA